MTLGNGNTDTLGIFFIVVLLLLALLIALLLDFDHDLVRAIRKAICAALGCDD
ncbi:hypothetical protein [Bacillus sp. T33-2]|uniref:hypothetical protein n=1 Tax=Bacillus sp. T33-2 TaxID=2054168 RepID=UPI0015E0FBD0|nr:hypothetical protein [Bacillus sp. T33-2]